MMSVIRLLGLLVLAESWSQNETSLKNVTDENAIAHNFSVAFNYSEANHAQEDAYDQPDVYPIINCTIEKQHEKPSSVHKLRPEDIDFIAALGDSTVAGTGSNESSKAWLDYRGLSFASGGDGNLSYITTLPNILRLYNLNITGYATGTGPMWVDNIAHLNMAEARARTKDISVQARRLLWRIGTIPENELKWKLITISVGSEDLCKFCFDQSSDHPFDWVGNIRKTLDYLKFNQKNVLINLVGLRNIKELSNLSSSAECKTTYQTRCPCLKHRRYDKKFKDFNQALQRVAKTYDRFDFAVVYQPMWTGLENGSESAGNKTRLDVLSADCFDLSADGQASAAAAIWNNMIEPVGQKDNEFGWSNIRLNCPPTACPYFRTNINSIDCNMTVQEMKFVVGTKRQKNEVAFESTLQTYFLVMIGLTTLLVVLGLVTAKVMDMNRRGRPNPQVITERTRLLNS